MQHPDWTKAIHHDGSTVYVSNALPALGESVEIKLRLPAGNPTQRVYLRTTVDGEQHYIQMSISRRDDLTIWYSGTLHMQNRRVGYRFRLMTPDGALVYNGLGVHRADVTDANDFKLLADFASPTWLRDAVFYQIFPERFANGDSATDPQPGTIFNHPPYEPFTSRSMDWDTDTPLPFKEGGSVDFFGGDLPGIEQNLDYITDLGANAIYLNPIFSSPSNHKYNISDFYTVDAHFGGNDALISLADALRRRNMRYVLDLTPNHTGDTHDWFRDAQADVASPTADYYTFYDHPTAYEAWLGVATLPKLDYTSSDLRDAMYRAPNAVMRHWLNAPYHADGWRLDVWNMTAVQGGDDEQHEVGREMRVAVKQTDPEAYLFGEHFFDATGSLQGDEMDAAMNYQGFSFPVWRWLAGHDLGAWSDEPPGHVDTTLLPAEAAVAQMQRYLSAIPWAIARMQFNQLGSHDTPRILSVVEGDEALAKLAAVLLLTYPGVPCIYYGDEIGMMGWADPDNRHPMRWDENRWNTDLRAHYQRLIELRRTLPALMSGGLQFLYAEGGALAYLRESVEQRVIVVACRDAGKVSIPVAQGNIPDGAAFEDALSGQRFSVADGELALGQVEAGSAWVLIH